MQVAIQLAVGLALSGLISFFAYRRKSLSRSGVAGAILVGTVIFGFGGWVWGMTLIAFFVLSSMLSHYKETAKQALSEKFAKGNQRDLGQALANGGGGALLALLYGLYPTPALIAAFIGAMATVNADTWATELGVLSKRHPHLITTWKPVEPGTSGGVSLLGTIATTGGALVIGIAHLFLLRIDTLLGGSYSTIAQAHGPLSGLWLLPSALLGGLAGSLFDSLLGATVQAIYYSPTRQKETEKRIDPDGTPNQHLRGWRWLGNDGVNLISSLVGAGVGAMTWLLLQQFFM